MISFGGVLIPAQSSYILQFRLSLGNLSSLDPKKPIEGVMEL